VSFGIRRHHFDRLGEIKGLRPPLFCIHQVEKGQNFMAITESSFDFRPFKACGGGVSPSALGDEGVPYFDLLRIRTHSVEKAPFEQFLITQTFKHLRAEGVKIDTEEAANPVVESAISPNNAHVISLGQFALGLKSDFVENPTENKDTTCLVAGTANGEAHDGVFCDFLKLAEMRSRIWEVSKFGAILILSGEIGRAPK
jgi:hypothetical protein